MKIRARLTIWYFTITFSLLVFFGFSVFKGMERLLFRALDRDIDILADSIELSYNPSTKAFEELAIDTTGLNPFIEFYLIVNNDRNEQIFKSPMAAKIDLGLEPERTESVQRRTLKARTQRGIAFTQSSAKGEVTFRALTRGLFYEELPIGSIAIALPIERIITSLHHLRNVLMLGIIIAGIVVVFSGYFLTRKSLRPVDVMTTKANEISYMNLAERLPVANTGDELGKLASTFNHLLERLDAAFKSQQQFLADAAHELKTPLAILRSHWEGEINNPHLVLDMKKRLVEDIETLSRLNHLINNLLLLSRTEFIQANFEYAPVQLGTIVQEVISDARILAEMKSQEIRIIEISAISLQGDRSRLYQMLFNIVENAITYTQERGKIWVALRRRGDDAVIEIKDDGPGIPEQDLPRIFERFYRVEKDRARKTGGSGLGLAISLLIAKSHGGTIDAASTLGTGTTFMIRLPLQSGTN